MIGVVATSCMCSNRHASSWIDGGLYPDILLREWHRLPLSPYVGQQLAYIRDDPNLEYV